MWSTVCNILVSDISIHALHEESDAAQVEQATGLDCISIHALHEESDLIALAVIFEY